MQDRRPKSDSDMELSEELMRGARALDQLQLGFYPHSPDYPYLFLEKGINILSFTHSRGKRLTISVGYAAKEKCVEVLAKNIADTLGREAFYFVGVQRGCVCFILNMTRGLLVSALILLLTMRVYPILPPEIHKHIEALLEVIFG